MGILWGHKQNKLHNKPEIIPIATCSSSKGLVINEQLNSADESTKEESIDVNSFIAKMNTASKSFSSRKRNRIINPVERRHQEKKCKDKINFCNPLMIIFNYWKSRRCQLKFITL